MVYKRHITLLFPSSPSTNFNQNFPFASLLLDLGLLFYTFLYISKNTYKKLSLLSVSYTFMTRDLLLDLGLFFYTFLYISNITYKNTLSFISAIYDLDQRSCLHCNIDEFSHTVNEFNRNLMTNMSLGNQIYDCL